MYFATNFLTFAMSETKDVTNVLSSLTSEQAKKSYKKINIKNKMKKRQKYSKCNLYMFSRAGVISVNNRNNCGNNEVENAIYLKSF